MILGKDFGGISPFRYVEPERREKLLRLLASEMLYRHSARIRKDGSTIWISEDVEVVRDTQGK
jgi:hypothetical protein